MRRLLFMRHAKSDWTEPGQADIDRGLNSRGLRDAPRMARWIESQGIVPQLILASTATRVRQTVDLLYSSQFIADGKWDPLLLFRADLYLAAPETILRAICADGGDSDSILIVAHNPGLECLVSQLAGESYPFPTAAIAVFQLADNHCWRDPLHAGHVKLEHFARPKAIDD